MTSMIRRLKTLVALAACGLVSASAQTFPLELRTDSGLFSTNLGRAINVHSARGVPISSVAGNGSDGRAPTVAQQGADGLTTTTPTPGQFRGLATFGGLAAPRTASLSNTNSYVGSAESLRVPRAVDASGNTLVVLRAAQVGAAWFSRQASLQFGGVIPPPAVDENGISLVSRGLRPEDYWIQEPYTTNSHSGAAYYWSRNALQVFAIQSGPVDVVWRKTEPLASAPADYATNPTAYAVQGNFYYRVSRVRYIVSGSPVKEPKKMYWTEGAFRSIGKPIVVPTARVGAVNFVYNNNLPERVDHEVLEPGQVPITSTNRLEETRTIWYDQGQGQIYAYNREGRVFMELLGDRRGDGTSRQFLGMEIVDVIRQAQAFDVRTELGDLITSGADPATTGPLRPEPVLQTTGGSYLQHVAAGASSDKYYAVRETRNLNDQLVYWMSEGSVGLFWPDRLVRYRLEWPTDPARYSHYVRPEVSTDADAAKTAVALPLDNGPAIEYQDALDFPRGKLTSRFEYYTFLDRGQPAHRALLRFSAGNDFAFERVYSWLDVALSTNRMFASTVATNLLGWDPTNQVFAWTDVAQVPRVVNTTALVGDRLVAPSGEPGSSGGSYYAGHIRTEVGDSFHPRAYVDPFGSGFDLANRGAIIPVNAIPGRNRMEVLWFRAHAPAAGFAPILWPSVIGRYLLAWPSGSAEIVLASNAGSGELPSVQARGSIYYQNDPTRAGYNPNEEHALMIGGRAWALRDDLNVTNAVGYSSDPFVLVDYTEADGRPAVRAFRVRREKPEADILFDYVAEAGRILQAPMPLPLLPPPVAGSGTTVVNYNTEPANAGGDLPAGWDPLRDPAGPFGHYRSFTFRDRKESYWLYRGLHGSLPAFLAGRYDPGTGTVSPTNAATAVVGQPFNHTVHATRRPEVLSVAFSPASSKPAWITITNLTLTGRPASGDVGTNVYPIVLTSSEDGLLATNLLTLRVAASGIVDAQSALTIASTNAYSGSAVTHVGRPPYLATPPAPTNSFTMRYYYKTEEGFAWPGFANPPAVGTIVPYLRPRNASGSGYAGDPTSRNTPSLDIVYRPVWPGNAPVLRYGETLTTAKNGLPEVVGQRSAGILYQQSLAADTNRLRVAVVLSDPTREKSADLAALGVDVLPPGIRTDVSRGKTYFPNLPPHLASRLFFDPSRGSNGQLVFVGQRVDNGVGESYLHLNVLRGQDLASVHALCPDAPADDKAKWTALVNGLATTVETFRPNPEIPGTFAPATNLTRVVGIGSLPEVFDQDTAVDSYALGASGPGDGFVTLLFGNGHAFTPTGEPVSVSVIRVAGSLYPGELKPIPSTNPLNELFTLQHTADLAGRTAEYEYEWRIARPVDGVPPAVDPAMSAYRALTNGTDLPRFTLGGSGVDVLSDNYIVMRYRPVNPAHRLAGQWSPWTTPQLVEGWIKRVLAGINPFNQRVDDLFDNQVNTDVSLLTQAGPRWEGDIALNLDNINDHGLIEIYETVLRRGRSLSIDAGISDSGANDALLLSAGYLNDLYMILGNEALDDSEDPTIGLGTQDRTYGDIATSLFSFKGQAATLLEEELALLRGRDDSAQPGVRVRPVYNRLFWNFTRGIDSGEVVYSLNYDIRDGDGVRADGVVDANDARRMFPQGHGDAYGHFLTAVKGYYSLMLSSAFLWNPRSESVTILGQPVQVDYMDERKFAAAAVSVAKSGLRVLDLTWRQDAPASAGQGWSRFALSKTNTPAPGTVAVPRQWGIDHWASRTGQGAYLNWVVGNSMLPAVDVDPTHEGIRKIDRTTVPELTELATTGDGIQAEMDSAEGGMTVLGLPAGGIAFDIDPNRVLGANGHTHFEQIQDRAKTALKNAVAAFDDAKDVSRLMRSEFDSLAGFQDAIDDQERAYENRLIELYGTPYTDDIGPGRTYRQDYAGPDLLHYQYVEDPTSLPGSTRPAEAMQVRLDLQQAPDDWRVRLDGALADIVPATSGTYVEGVHYVTLNVSAEGLPTRPAAWRGSRRSPGKIQQAISALLAARARLSDALGDAEGAKGDLDQAISLYRNELNVQGQIRDLERSLLTAEQTLSSVQFASDIWEQANASAQSVEQQQLEVLKESMPRMFIAGLAAGGDLTSPARAVVQETEAITSATFEWADFLRFFAVRGLEFSTETTGRWVTADQIAPRELGLEKTAAMAELVDAINSLGDHFGIIDHRLRELDDARRAYRALVAEGDRLQDERAAFRKRSAALVQGYRTRDAAFRFFRSEKLERYKSLFDLAARYTYLAANAFDYETGLLGTERGQAFVQRILRSRALGVVRNGEPQFAGADSGDPGLSGVLAEMASDWSALRGRLGLNNPDVYSTTASLRVGLNRILPGVEGDQSWKDVLASARRDNLLDDDDVRRHCLQLGGGNGLKVPGLVIEFGTVVAEGRNLFGLPLAAGDVAFSPSSYATKIYAAGVAFEGYRGMDTPSANSSAVSGGGGVSPSDPSLTFLDPLALSATPYVYLIPAGVDSMRSPPIGDSSEIRSWTVHDVTVPLPFDLGGVESALREVEVGADSLSESLFSVRGHQAFRAVGSSAVFSQNLFGAGGQMIPSQYTNRRLIGRSAWNSRWKLVIPGSTLLNDPNEGLDRFLRTVGDIRVHFVTYSYSGN